MKTTPSHLKTATLMCHAPIVIPDIAQERASEVQLTTESMVKAAQHTVNNHIDVLVLCSPHTTRTPREFCFVADPDLHISFAAFGQPDIDFCIPNNLEILVYINQYFSSHKLPVNFIELPTLDHGAGVPLYFIHESGWRGPTLVFGFPYYPEIPQCQMIGKALADLFEDHNIRWGLVASGDMSHRLMPGAPAGYHPQAHIFDQYVVEALKTSSWSKLMTIDPALRQIAAEDIIDSLAVSYGAIGDSEINFLSYERPFGVGYSVAILK